jgi:acyl-CoA thioester hydrolase
MVENIYIHGTEFSVRDYECDLQGVVNNANYQHYFEHARHEFLLFRGISFVELHEEGIDLIVTRIEIDYKWPLRSRDKFIVRLNFRREGNVRLLIGEDIYRLPDEKLIARAVVTAVATRKGKPVAPGDLIQRLGLE